MDQPHIIPHVGLFRVSSAGRDKTRSQHRTSPESSAGIKSFTRYNLNFNPVNASKPPMPPQSLNNNRSSSSETRRPRAKLDRTQRSSVSWYLQLQCNRAHFDYICCKKIQHDQPNQCQIREKYKELMIVQSKKRANSLKRGKTRVTKSCVLQFFHLIVWEVRASFLDQSHSEEANARQSVSYSIFRDIQRPDISK